MLMYPQLLSGAVAQFPLRKTYTASTIANIQEDGSRYLANATDAARVTWHLLYQGMNQQEVDTLRQFFYAARGRLQSFLFLDPTSNLLAWSKDLLHVSWELTPYTNVSAVESDFEDSFELAAPGAGIGKLTQTVPVPAVALVCFSLYARSEQPTTLLLAVGDQSSRIERSLAVGFTWQRYSVTQSGSGYQTEKQVEVSLAAGSRIALAQLCLTPQPAPGGYTGTSDSTGLMFNTRFDQDALAITSTGTGTFGCSVVVSARLD